MGLPGWRTWGFGSLGFRDSLLGVAKLVETSLLSKSQPKIFSQRWLEKEGERAGFVLGSRRCNSRL